MLRLMDEMLKLIWWIVNRFFRSRASLDAEIATVAASGVFLPVLLKIFARVCRVMSFVTVKVP